MKPRVLVTGIPELRRLLRRVGGREMEKELGQVHKSIGQMVIKQLGGPATGVGAGAGSRIRPSAAVREVQLRVGGSHRSRRVEQWGRQWRPEHGRRPYLIGAAIEIQPEIEEAYLQGLDALFRRHGLT